MEIHPRKFLKIWKAIRRNFCLKIVQSFEIFANLAILSQSRKGAFSSVSTPNFARKYALESSRRDLHNALLRTVIHSQNLSQTSEKRKMLSNAYLLFSIYLQNFVLIQPRTSPPNICKILQKKNYQNLIANLIVVLLIRTSKPISPDSSTSPQVPAHDRPPQQLLRPGARARRGGGPGRGRAGAAKDTNE